MEIQFIENIVIGIGFSFIYLGATIVMLTFFMSKKVNDDKIFTILIITYCIISGIVIGLILSKVI